MKSLQITSFVILLGMCFSQVPSYESGPVLVVEDFSIAQGNPVPYVKTWENQWNDVLDFAVYGWIRIPKWVNNEIQIFRLSANRDLNSNQVGDRVLRLFAQDNMLMCETYDAQNSDPKVQHNYLPNGDSFGNWFYVYLGYSNVKQQTYGYVASKSGTWKYNTSNQLARHSYSDFYQLIIGPNNGVTNGDQVDVKVLYIEAGDRAYRESDWNKSTGGSVIPGIPHAVNCPTVYSECGYQGVQVSYCENDPQIKLPVIRSVIVPPNFSYVKFYNMDDWKGKWVIFYNQVECVDQVFYTTLIEQGQMEIVDESQNEKKIKKNLKKKQ